MTEGVQSRRSRTQSSRAEGANLLLATVFYAVWFSLVAVAQEPTYSADSLMAAFEKGSKTSPKGTQITFAGVIAESKKSKVTFKSSGNDKVVCELVSSIDTVNEALVVGRPLTVIGKVRGRGMLGNVTLDECHVVLADGIKAAVDPKNPSRKLLLNSSNTQQKREVTKPVAGAVSTKPKGPIRATATVTTVPGELASSKDVEPNKGIGESSSSSKAGFPDIFRVFVAVLVGLALFAIMKLAPFLFAIGSKTSQSSPGTSDTRRAALEALLSAQKNKK